MNFTFPTEEAIKRLIGDVKGFDQNGVYYDHEDGLAVIDGMLVLERTLEQLPTVESFDIDDLETNVEINLLEAMDYMMATGYRASDYTEEDAAIDIEEDPLSYLGSVRMQYGIKVDPYIYAQENENMEEAIDELELADEESFDEFEGTDLEATKKEAQNEQPTLVWDTYEIAKQQADFLKEENPELSDDEAFNLACEDSDILTVEWEWLCDSLTELMQKINPEGSYWKVDVEGFGWRGQSGYKTFSADDGQTLLREILPKTNCTFQIYDRGDEIAINNAHHDKPTGGEWYYIKPISDEELEKEMYGD